MVAEDGMTMEKRVAALEKEFGKQHNPVTLENRLKALESVLKGHVQAVSSSCYIYEPDGNTEKEKICYLETIKDKLLEKLSAKDDREAGISRIRDFISKHSIHESSFYYDCNVVDCPIKTAVLSYDGNDYCMEHFLELVIDGFKQNLS